MDKKSPDAFRTISEVAEWLGVPTHVLRFWESRFTQVKPVKRAGGRRYYRPADMELLGGIRKLLHEDGVTIRGVQKLLREKGVKHVAAMSPAIDSDELRDEGTSNIVSLATLRDDAPEIMEAPSDSVAPTAPPKSLTTEHTQDEMPAPVSAPPEAAQSASAEPEANTEQMDVAPPTQTTPLEDTPYEVDTETDVPSGAGVSDTPNDTTFTSDVPADGADKLAETAAPVDPLEPIPHDGPTIAETLAAHRTLGEAPLPGTDDLPATEELPAVTPDDVLVTAEHDTATDGTAPMDLFAFADTVSSEDPVPAGPVSNEIAAADLTEDTQSDASNRDEYALDADADADADADETRIATVQDAIEEQPPVAPNTETSETPAQAVTLPPSLDSAPEAATLVEAPISMPETPIAASGGDTFEGDMSEDTVAPESQIEAPTTAFAETAEAAVAPDAPSEMPEVTDIIAPDQPQHEELGPPASEMAASLTEKSPSTATPDMPDISHIPADPIPGQTAEQPDSATLSIRLARANGTDAHLPVLQALADRLDALAVQMNRSGRS